MPELNTLSPIVIVMLLWSMPWKGYALWKAARKKHTVWFVILLAVNTVALLEIAYIFYFSEKKSKSEKNAETH